MGQYSGDAQPQSLPSCGPATSTDLETHELHRTEESCLEMIDLKRYAVIGLWVAIGFMLSTTLHTIPNNHITYSYGAHLKKLAAYMGGNAEETSTTPAADSEELRVLCWVMTTPANHDAKARHVKATWGRRCTKLLFMSSAADAALGAIALGVGEGRQKLWAKTRAAFKYVYEHHRDDADWFLKADDDTYVVMENLRQLLSLSSPSEPLYTGCHFHLLAADKQPIGDAGYMSGGAGYVLSNAALRRVVEISFDNPRICKQNDSYAEDVVIGKCLERAGVRALDSRDALGLTRFMPLPPHVHLVPNATSMSRWYTDYMFHRTSLPDGACCSDTAISFHYVKPTDMYIYDFLIYRLKLGGLKCSMFLRNETLFSRENVIQ